MRVAAKVVHGCVVLDAHCTWFHGPQMALLHRLPLTGFVLHVMSNCPSPLNIQCTYYNGSGRTGGNHSAFGAGGP